jgi:small subunit ribosomal protein S19
MSRSTWKGPFIEKSFFKQSLKKQTNKKIELKTWSRKSTILPYLVGKIVNIHNGKKFLKLKINEQMLGHKLGEFVPTRARFFYKKTKNK